MNEHTNHYPPPIPDSYVKIHSMKPQKPGPLKWVIVACCVVGVLVALGAVFGDKNVDDTTDQPEQAAPVEVSAIIEPTVTTQTSTTTTTLPPTTTTVFGDTGIDRSIASMTEYGYDDNDIEEMVVQYLVFGDSLRNQTARELIILCDATENMGRQETLDFIKTSGDTGSKYSHPQLVGTALALDEACGRL